jgi:hypothetical protein
LIVVLEDAALVGPPWVGAAVSDTDGIFRAPQKNIAPRLPSQTGGAFHLSVLRCQMPSINSSSFSPPFVYSLILSNFDRFSHRPAKTSCSEIFAAKCLLHMSFLGFEEHIFVI